ncbi:DUF1289 domain-containing protein [Aestuariibacter sp. AA17]|uniref:DUF1289 domain-containing protein n=1 Tax=Fluctibacter corallii TaxID=2984329 RepID=A0ABT3A584_9ALTE|nr:DUF1289 domain-containing protein [Aestuariibacter sp. AA17]MCV2883840.1 DUF1289 domain-containing protein [Aestuariibacter sp. AA17]
MTISIQSPCIGNCCLDEDDICIGCRRSLEEITRWGSASEEERISILSAVESRKTSDQVPNE